jgi:hypothetical protein
MTPSNACTRVIINARAAIPVVERMARQHSAAMRSAMLREAAYRATPSLLGPSKLAIENPALTPALITVIMAQVQNCLVMEVSFDSVE